MSYRTNDVEVVATQLFPEAEALKDLVALLSESERDRASRFVFDRDRRRFIVGRARLRQLLAERLGVAPQSVELTYGACGKPALANSPRLDLRFNMSHCDDLAVYAFSHGTDVGIDVEAIRFLPDADRIAALFFSRRENETYGALAPHDKPLGFFNCWTRKEAFIKALGHGLGFPLDSFDVSLAPDEPPMILRVGTTPGEECDWRMASFSPALGYVAAVVTESIDATVAIEIGNFPIDPSLE
jgi:4'-phosphopantetheinyl transferase